MSKPKKERGVIKLRLRRRDFSEMLKTLGCVNEQPVKISGKIYPPETLQVLPPTASVYVTRQGFRRWKVIGYLWIRRRGWNTFERGDSGEFGPLINV